MLATNNNKYTQFKIPNDDQWCVIMNSNFIINMELTMVNRRITHVVIKLSFFCTERNEKKNTTIVVVDVNDVDCLYYRFIHIKECYTESEN